MVIRTELFLLPHIPPPERGGNCYHANECGLLKRAVFMGFATTTPSSVAQRKGESESSSFLQGTIVAILLSKLYLV